MAAPITPMVPDPVASRQFLPGQHVTITGLKGKPHLNGCAAAIIGWDAEKGRYNVRESVDGAIIAVKPGNLEGRDDEEGTTGFIAACAAGDLLEVQRQFSLTRAQHAASDDTDGKVGLHVACNKGNLKVVEWLVDTVADFDVPSFGSSRSKPIHWAAEGGHVDVVGALHAKGVSLEQENGEGMRPIHFAASNGHLALSQWLHAQGVSLDARIRTGEQPIHLAAQRYNRLDAVQWLHEQGVPLDVKGGPLSSLLIGACHGTQMTRRSEYRGFRLQLVEWLLSEGAPVNECLPPGSSTPGLSPLHVASLVGHVELIELLLAHGAEIEAVVPESNKRPIHLAINNGHLEAVRVLHANGASMEVKERGGMTPLFLAIEHGHLEIVQLLHTSAGLPLTTEISASNVRLPPLLAACLGGQLEILQWIHAQGVPLDAADSHGRLATHIVCSAPDDVGEDACLAVIEWLHGHAVPLAQRDENGNTPKYYALRRRRLKLGTWLTNHGA